MVHQRIRNCRYNFHRKLRTSCTSRNITAHPISAKTKPKIYHWVLARTLPRSQHSNKEATSTKCASLTSQEVINTNLACKAITVFVFVCATTDSKVAYLTTANIPGAVLLSALVTNIWFQHVHWTQKKSYYLNERRAKKYCRHKFT